MLVLKCGIDPRYVLDEMPLYEADLYLSHAYYIGQEIREDIRVATWMTAQVNSKKKLKPSDIYTFAWEHKKQEPVEAVTPEQLKALTASAHELRKKLKHGK